MLRRSPRRSSIGWRLILKTSGSALRDVSPSAMREVMLEVTHVTWQDVGGLEEAKQEVREAVELPLTDRIRFENSGSIRREVYCCTDLRNR